MRHNEAQNFLVIEDPGIGRVINKLRKGMHIKSRIVLKLGERHYALRLFGYNLLMESGLAFARFDEILIRVQKVRPKLVLKLIKVKKIPDSRKNSNRRMNIIV